ncbi:MAG: hypothetical protein LBE89_05610 [Helicobacteraceae bacterium]|jgi:hypothetical protein|nr:hypothetical protein [Helicobacteraceae bacterium]
MKIIVLWLGVWALIGFACSGDCASCHKILDDDEHRVLNECVECHIEITNVNAECGGNCFSCHNAAALNSEVDEHKTLKDCKTCHISAENNSIFGKKMFDFDLEQTLKNTIDK